MGITRVSETQASRNDLRAMPTDLAYEPDRITRLVDYAIETPESRKRVIAVLEKYEDCCEDLQMAVAAHRAISAILAVSMLETLQGQER
jgi:hypothetical protein